MHRTAYIYIYIYVCVPKDKLANNIFAKIKYLI